MATLYAAKGGLSASDLYILDSVTGAESSVGPTGFAITGLAFDPTSGILYGSTSNAGPSPNGFPCLITIDTSTGVGTYIADFEYPDTSSSGPIADICFDSTGQMYGWSEDTDVFVIIDKDTAITTVPHSHEHNTFGDACDVSPIDGELYACIKGSPDGTSGGSSFDNWGTYYTIDKTTGATTLVGKLTGGPDINNDAVNAGSFDSSGVFWAFINESSSGPVDLVNIDVSTGVVSAVAVMSGAHWDGIAWTAGAATLHANFTGTPLVGRLPLTVNFTDHSTAGAGGAITGWSWDFGDGGTSTSASPSYVYTTPGIYTVSLTVTSPDGTDTKTRTDYVKVAAPQTLYGASGEHFGNQSNLYTVNPSTGVTSLIGEITGYQWNYAIAFDTIDGTLYAASEQIGGTSSTDLITIDINTGTPTVIGDLGDFVTGLAFDLTGQLWGWSYNSGNGQLVTIDKATAARTVIASYSGDTYGAFSFDSSGVLWHALGDFALVHSVNTSTGVRTNHGSVSGPAFLDSGSFDNLDLLWGSSETDLYTISPTDPTASSGSPVTETYISTFDTAFPPYIEAIAWQPSSTNPDFILSVDPDPVSVAPTGTGSTSLTAVPLLSDTESITLSSSGAPAGMTIGFDDNPINAGDTTNINITNSGVANGAYTITIHAIGTSNTHTISFTVLVTTGLSTTLDINSGSCDTQISISGSGFAPSSALHLFWDGVNFDGSVTGTTTTDGSGSFSGLLFFIPNGTAGSHTIKIVDFTGLNKSTTFNLTVPSFTMTPSTITSSRSTDVIFSGTNYPPSTAIYIYVSLGAGRIGGGGTQWIDFMKLGGSIVSGSLTTDSSGNFSAVVNIPANDFPAGTWTLAVDSQVIADFGSPATCSSSQQTLTVCSRGGAADTPDLSHNPVLVGHAAGNDIPPTVILGVSYTRVTISGHNYDLLEGYGVVKCGGYYYSLFKCAPDNSPGATLPIPSVYHKMIMYQVAVDGSSSNYYFVDPKPFYRWNFSGSANNGHNTGTLSYVDSEYFVIHAQLVSDGTDVWVAMIAGETDDYPYISNNDTHGFLDQASQTASRGGLSGMISTLTSSPGTTWSVDYWRQEGFFGSPRAPESDGGDSFSGTYTRPVLSVHHFNGSSFDRIDEIEGPYCRIRNSGSGPLETSSYVSGVAACASSAEAGVVHAVWSYGGAWGQRYNGSTSFDVWDSQYASGIFMGYGIGAPNLDYVMNYSKWSTSSKIADNDLRSSHTDRTGWYTLTTSGRPGDKGLVQTSDFVVSNEVILKNDHGSVIAFVSDQQTVYEINEAFDNDYNNFVYKPDFYSKYIQMWDLSGGTINVLQTLDDSVLPTQEEVDSRTGNDAPSGGINRIAASYGPGDYTTFDHNVHAAPDVQRYGNQNGQSVPGGMGASPLYHDPLIDKDVYLINALFLNRDVLHSFVGERTDTVGFFRIPCDGSQPFDVMDGNRQYSILPNPSVTGYGFIITVADFFSDPNNVWVVNSGSTALSQLDRQCFKKWLAPGYARGSLGPLYVGSTFSGGFGNVLPWAAWQENNGFWFDGNNTFYVMGRWEHSIFDSTIDWIGMGQCVIGRDTISCPTCPSAGGAFIRIHPNGDVILDQGNLQKVTINPDGTVSVADINAATVRINTDGTVKRLS